MFCVKVLTFKDTDFSLVGHSKKTRCKKNQTIPLMLTKCSTVPENPQISFQLIVEDLNLKYEATGTMS